MVRSSDPADRTVLWAHHTAASLRALAGERPVVILPVGSTEQHGPHLPLGTDSVIAEAIAVEAALSVRDEVPVVVAPLLPYGYSARHFGFHGVLTLSMATLQALVLDLVESLKRYDLRKLLMLNGHGGNHAGLAAAAAVACAERGMTAACANYWELIAPTVATWRESPMGGIGHAGELETSLMMYLAGPRVDAGPASAEIPRLPSERYVSEDMYGAGCVTYPGLFKHFSRSGVMGDPSTASARKGSTIFGLAVDAFADFLRDFAAWDSWEDSGPGDLP